MSTIRFRALGLTQEEVIALTTAANGQMAELREHVPEYDLKYEESTMKRLKKVCADGDITKGDVDRLYMLQSLIGVGFNHFKPFKDLELAEDGHYTNHPSFGRVGRTDMTSNMPVYVGSPSLDSTGVSVKFHQAEMKLDSDHNREPQSRETRGLFEVTLAAEQFAQLLRYTSSESPCCISRSNISLVDMPPRLIEVVSIAKEVRQQALALVAPVVAAAQAVQDRVASAQKVSGKAGYAELLELGQALKQAMNEAHGPLKELLSLAAGQMAASSSRQLYLEVAEPLKQLGMEPSLIQRLLN